MGLQAGHPEHFGDDSGYGVSRDDLAGNVMAARKALTRRTLGRINAAVERGAWDVSPITVAGFYEGPKNRVILTAAILQPPFFCAKGDVAANFGAIGSLIGHEFTHGFDNNGRRYDSEGRLRDWWKAADAKAFARRSQGLVRQYSRYAAVLDPMDPSKNVMVDGRLTLNENISDNGGARLAYMALQRELADGEAYPPADGFSPEQRFFLALGQSLCARSGGEEWDRLMARSNKHSPERYKVNGVLSNMGEFQKAFSCRDTAPMVQDRPNRVW
jgi:predicted metalloendopeptidase